MSKQREALIIALDALKDFDYDKRLNAIDIISDTILTSDLSIVEWVRDALVVALCALQYALEISTVPDDQEIFEKATLRVQNALERCSDGYG